MGIEHVPGKDAGHIMLYALSTCGWCRKTKQLLDELGLEYDYQYVDLASTEERKKLLKEVEEWNPSRMFPTLVIDNDRCIVGFKEEEIKALGNG